MYTVPAKILYLQRYLTDFRNICLTSKMSRVRIWVESFRSAGVLTLQWQGEIFAHRKHLKFCHFQPLHCPRKNPVSPKLFPPIFEIFPPTRRCWWWAFGWKVSRAHVFYFCNGKVKTSRIDNIWNFAIHNLYNVPAKILCLQRHSTDFRNLCFSSKILRVGIWVESFICAGILLLQWQGENFARRQHFKFLQLSTCTLCQQKSNISKDIQQIFEIFASARRCWGSAFGWKVSGVQVFYFCNGKVKLCASTTFEILPVSTCTLCR